MTLLVTGATGFVGGHVVREAVQRGLSVRGVIRQPEVQLPPGVEPAFVPDLSDHAALIRAANGCSAILHLAARVHVMRESDPDPLAAFRRVNVAGTQAVLHAAAETGVRRVVILSSVKVNGEGRETSYTQSDVPAPADPYGISKLEAEEVVLSDLASVQGVALRAPLVYGPGVGGNFLRLMSVAYAARRLPMPLGGISNRRSLVYVGNLADALLHLVDAPEAPGKRFLVSDGRDQSTSALVRGIGEAGGWNTRLIPCPVRTLRTVAALFGRTADIDRLLGSLTVDTSALRATGWQPPFTVHQGLRATVRWWLHARE